LCTCGLYINVDNKQTEQEAEAEGEADDDDAVLSSGLLAYPTNSINNSFSLPEAWLSSKLQETTSNVFHHLADNPT
jgi:uncharacterized protein YuzB (UPF0349 family)